MLSAFLPRLDRSTQYQFSPADPILPRSEWLVIAMCEENFRIAHFYRLTDSLFHALDGIAKIDQPLGHYDRPCNGNAEECDGPCYDLCDCPHCDGGWYPRDLEPFDNGCPCDDELLDQRSAEMDAGIPENERS